MYGKGMPIGQFGEHVIRDSTAVGTRADAFGHEGDDRSHQVMSPITHERYMLTFGTTQGSGQIVSEST
eukprot:1102808-Amphidinium_carterae.1